MQTNVQKLRILQVRAYLTPEENKEVPDSLIEHACILVEDLPFSPLGVARVIRSAIRKGVLDNDIIRRSKEGS